MTCGTSHSYSLFQICKQRQQLARFSPSFPSVHSPLSPYSPSTFCTDFAVASSTAIHWASRSTALKPPALRSSQVAHHRQREGRSWQISVFFKCWAEYLEALTMRDAISRSRHSSSLVWRSCWLKFFFFLLFPYLSIMLGRVCVMLGHTAQQRMKS